MKLITEHGELPLPEDLEIEIERNNPAFSEDGTSSLPVTIPATGQSLKVLKHPARVASATRLRKVKATLSEGIYVKTGQLLIDSASNDGITCSFSYAESDFYAQFKDAALREIFASKQDMPIGVESLYEKLIEVMSGTLDKDYTICPVAVDYDQESGSYRINNAPKGDGGIEYVSRYIPEGNNRILVPVGYGLATFLYLHRLIELLFELNGYTVESDEFKDDDELKRIIVLHNVSDAICTGKIDYSDMVPDMTVSEFLDWLHDKFFAVAVIDSEKRTVNIRLMQSILNGKTWDLDLTGRIDKGHSLSFNGTSRVVISVDTSLDGATPPSETLDVFANNNPVVTDVNETVFNASNMIYKYVAARRLSTGDYYSFASSIGEENPVTSSARSGSSYFSYGKNENTDGTEEFSPSDLMPPMVFVDGILMPYIGNRIHRHTQLDGKSEGDTTQKIIIAYDSGYRSDNGYRIATTQNYDETGAKWTEHSLNPYDIYTRFFSAYNGLLKRGMVELSGNVVLSASELLNFDLMRPKFYKGKLLLCTKLSYTIKKGKIDRGTSTFLIVEDVSDPDIQPTFKRQEYYWALCTDKIQERVQELEDKPAAVGGNAKYSLPEEAVKPTSAPSGKDDTGYYQYIQVEYTMYSLNTGEIFYNGFEPTLVWFKAKLI